MGLSKLKMMGMLKTMLRVRYFEEILNKLAAEGKTYGFVHLYIGEEAIATGVCAALNDSDFITSTHRGHGHVIARGGKLDLMMAEVFQKSTGYCQGKGGSMHISDFDLGIIGANGIVGAGAPLAVGAALAAQYKETGNVAVCFFGDGASNQGIVHEALNLAAIWKLPVIFVIENNGYTETTRQLDHLNITYVSDRAAGYNMPAVIVDGNDVMAVFKAASAAVAKARRGKGPAMIECKTFRISGYYAGDPEYYRDKAEVQKWKTPEKDPISRFEKLLLATKIADEAGIEEVKAQVKEEIQHAVTYATTSPAPEPTVLLQNVYAE